MSQIPLVVIVGADKGGVGKTTLSRVLLDYFKTKGADARAFDTEWPQGVLKRFHPDKTEVVDLAHSDGQMAVFDTLGKAAVTMIDVRAGLLSPTLKTLGELGFLAMVRSDKIKIVVFHVIGSTVASFNEIRATQQALAGRARHVIVTNRTNDANFFEGIDGVDKDAIRAATKIDVPKLNERATEHIEAASLPFSDFIADESQSLTMRRYAAFWLEQIAPQLDGLALLG